MEIHTGIDANPNRLDGVTSKPPVCVDCLAEGITNYRPIVSGVRAKRCATHSRAAGKRASAIAHARTVASTYGISGEQYWALHRNQNGKCAICQVATGATKRLAVDHDHATGLIRGCCCGPCNIMLGRLGPEGLVRALEYLLDPPAVRVIGCHYVQSTDVSRGENWTVISARELIDNPLPMPKQGPR